jgi:hypothetical protein
MRSPTCVEFYARRIDFRPLLPARHARPAVPVSPIERVPQKLGPPGLLRLPHACAPNCVLKDTCRCAAKREILIFGPAEDLSPPSLSLG